MAAFYQRWAIGVRPARAIIPGMFDRAYAVLDPPTTRATAEEWALVLASQGIPSRTLHADEGWVIALAHEDAERAALALAAYVTENVVDDAPEPTLVRRRAWAGAGVAALILALFPVTGTRSSGTWWYSVGRSDAARMLDGQPWRAATALTLHADLTHVASNVLASLLFGTYLGRTMGDGFALAAMLGSGILGNMTNVWLRGAPYAGVGASTAVFGAVGALAGARAASSVRPTAIGGRWLPIAAGLGLLALLGSSETADVLAHAFGFMWGVPLGALATWLDRRTGRTAQIGAGIGAALSLAAAWALAYGARAAGVPGALP